MKATLTFNLPEENDEFILATRGSNLYRAIWDYDQELRKLLKYGDLPADLYDLYEKIRTQLHDHLEAHDVSLDMVD